VRQKGTPKISSAEANAWNFIAKFYYFVLCADNDIVINQLACCILKLSELKLRHPVIMVRSKRS